MLGFGDRKTLSQALTDDDVPTSGFLFAEIASTSMHLVLCLLLVAVLCIDAPVVFAPVQLEITHKSVSDCQALEDYLLNQLDKGSLRIKLKVLKVRPRSERI